MSLISSQTDFWKSLRENCLRVPEKYSSSCLLASSRTAESRSSGVSAALAASLTDLVLAAQLPGLAMAVSLPDLVLALSLPDLVLALSLPDLTLAAFFSFAKRCSWYLFVVQSHIQIFPPIAPSCSCPHSD